MNELDQLTQRLTVAGFVAADEEARELCDGAKGDGVLLRSMIERRLTGEPLAWITGTTAFCGIDILVTPGVYIPRWQSEPLARRALSRLPEHGTALDLCTGSGAIARFLLSNRPDSRVVATDLDERAVACASANGVEVYHGDLFAPVPQELRGALDVIVAVVPYVPTKSMDFLPRDTFHFESVTSYDGGERGVDVLRRVIAQSPSFLRSGGALLLELGGDQSELLEDQLAEVGFSDVATLLDDEGDTRGIEATLGTYVEVLRLARPDGSGGS